MKDLTLYDQFLEEFKRLFDKHSLQEFAVEYIYKNLTDSELLSILNHKEGNMSLPVFSKKLITNQRVFIQVVKILALMETSNTKEEFTKLDKKRKERKQQPSPVKVEDFNNILKNLLSTPPNKKKK